MHSCSFFLTTAAALISFVRSDGVVDPNAICYSYGVDFVDEGSYFINSQLNEQFGSVSYFKGCNQEVADVVLIEPDESGGEEYICEQIPTYPDNQFETSLCPIQKKQMTSGHWLLLILGNNGDGGQPFAWQRDLYLTVGTPATSTFTPTATFSYITTPVETRTSTTTDVEEVTIGPLFTITLPSGIAKKTKTVKPKAVKTTSTKYLTITKLSLTNIFGVTTQTATATCTTPGHPARPDKPCRHSPTKIHPAALVTPTTIPKLHRFMRKADRAIDIEWARARIHTAKQKRAEKAHTAASPLKRRAPDSSVITVTADVPVNTTTTITAPASITTETVEIDETTTTTLPPETVYKGVSTNTITLPTPTKTKLRISLATTTKVITMGAILTKHTTVTPAASISACKEAGGHF
jgi:hypothetical protein